MTESPDEKDTLAYLLDVIDLAHGATPVPHPHEYGGYVPHHHIIDDNESVEAKNALAAHITECHRRAS